MTPTKKKQRSAVNRNQQSVINENQRDVMQRDKNIENAILKEW